MKTLKLHITLLFMILWNFSFSQQYTHYTTKVGLPSNHVYRITQDYQGFIWFITDKGMVKYNGTTFKTFTTKEGLPTNDIWNIRVTPDHKVWFFSKVDKLGYIHKDSVYTFKSSIKNDILHPLVIYQNENKISFDSATKHYTLENNTWIASTINLDKYEHQLFVSHHEVDNLTYSTVSSSVEVFDKKGENIVFLDFGIQLDNYRGQINDSLFCRTDQKGFTIVNLNTLQQFDYPFSKAQKGVRNYVRFNQANNQIQFTGQGFVGILDKNYQLKNTLLIPDHIESHFSYIDRNENLWIATFDSGVYFISKAKRKTINFLENKNIEKLTQTNDGIIANVHDDGFYQYQPNIQEFVPLVKENGTLYSVNHIEELNATYYCSYSKIIEKNNQSTKTYTFNKNINEKARQLIYHKKKLYGHCSHGLNILNPDNFTVTDSIIQYGIRNMLVFNNQLLLATSNGLKKLDNSALKFVFPVDKNINKPILSLTKTSDENLLICTDGFGVYLSDLENISLIEQTEYLSVEQAFAKNNEIWLATTKGVWHYTKENGTYKLQKKYTIDDGLSSNFVNSVIVKNNKIIAGSDVGVSITPMSKQDNNSYITLYFDEITYNNKPINEKVRYTTNNHLNVSVFAVDFSEINKLQYSYKLLPIQKDWFHTQSNQISFNDLPPNEYQLLIKSNNNTNSLSFDILPLWYQTSIAKVLFSLIVLLILFGFFFYIRKREIKKQIQKLNEKRKLAKFELHALRSQMNPHFVFNSLNAIQYYLNDNKIELSERYLVKFSRLIRMFFDFSQKKVISLKEEIQLLNGYLEIEKLRFGDDLNYSIKVTNDLDTKRKIPVMILQPLVENSVNHGLFHKKGKGSINITFNRIDTDTYEVLIEDDGIGIKKATVIKHQSTKKHLSKSTHILKERISLLNMSKDWEISYRVSDIDKEKQSGTKVFLKFKRQ